jgi:hypothetical protein
MTNLATGDWNYNLEEATDEEIILVAYRGAFLEVDTWTPEGFKALLERHSFKFIAWAKINTKFLKEKE